MNEDKQKICELLLPVLQATRGAENVTALEYSYDEFFETEFVIARFQYGYKREIDVTGDSGIQMIKDIMRGIGC